MKNINVLSLFDGISCGQIALERAGIKVKAYYASEINNWAIKVTQHNYPNTIQLGDITKIKGYNLPKIDLLIGGSPCQGFSFAGKQLAFNDPRSKLFFEYMRILKKINPIYFLLENVRMKKEHQDVISKLTGVEPILINSALVSAQSRKRLYWTNIPNVTQPEDKHIYLKDILEIGYTEKLKSYCIDATYYKGTNLKHYLKKGVQQLIFNKPIQIGQIPNWGMGGRIYSCDGKSCTLKALGGGGGAKTGLYFDNNDVRKLTPLECERLQGLPNNYTEGVSNTQRYKMLGNGWTVDIIVHIFKNMKDFYDN